MKLGGQTVTVCFSEMIDPYLFSAEFDLCNSEKICIGRLSKGVAHNFSHYERFTRTWIIDYVTCDLSALYLIVRYRMEKYVFPFPSTESLSLHSRIKALFKDATLSALLSQIEPQDIVSLQKELLTLDLSVQEREELLGLLNHAHKMLDTRVKNLKQRIRMLFTDETRKALLASITQADIDEIGDEVQNELSWCADYAEIQHQISDAQQLLLNETVLNCKVNTKNHVTVTFSQTQTRHFRDYHYFLRLNDEDQSELQSGEPTYPSRLDALSWTVPLTPKLTDAFSLEVRKAGNTGETYTLYKSAHNVFYESYDTKSETEDKMNALFSDVGFTVLRNGVVLKDIDMLEQEISGRKFDAEFLSVLTERLQLAKHLLKKEQEDLKLRIHALYADETKKVLRTGEIQVEIDSILALLESKNSTAPPYDTLMHEVDAAQLTLLKESLSSVTIDALNNVIVVFSTTSGRDFRNYDYDVFLNEKRLTELNQGIAVSPCSVKGTSWIIPTTGGPADTMRIEVRRGPLRRVIHTSSAGVFYTSATDQLSLENKLNALKKGKALVPGVTQDGLDALWQELSAMKLAGTQRTKLTAMLDAALPLLLNDTLSDVMVDDFNKVLVKFN
ncbi:hypothetical protein ACOZB2_30650, partial [Pantoea endophytica]